MQIVGVSVEVNKMLSDGDYGHESAQVAYTAELEDGDDPEAATAELLARARAQCAARLNASESLNVRRKINAPRRICNECLLELADDIRGYLHPACDEKIRAERDAQRSAALADIPF
jgi:hypothetical protein